MPLRPYQLHAVQDVIRALSKSDRALVHIPTGGGKGEIMFDLASKAKRPVVMLMGKDRLISQTARRCREVIPETCVWSAGQREKRIGRVTVVSIHSADGLTVPDAGLILLDEAHNAGEGRYARFLERHAQAKLVGFTATPWRSAAPIYGSHEGALFPSVTYKIDMLSLIAEGYLVPAVAKAMPLAWDASRVAMVGGDYNQGQLADLVSDHGKVRDQVADALPRLNGRASVVWICTSIEHAEDVLEQIRAQSDDSATVIHSKSEEDDALDRFSRGEIRHIVSVMMLTEGIDIPRIDAIILMRPTRSPTLMVQAIGRGLRPYPGKAELVVLDYGEVLLNCGPIIAPYLREPGKKRDVTKQELAVCPECLSYIPPRSNPCPDCGAENRREIDRLAKLKREAADIDPMALPATVEMCSGVRILRHKARSGNDCIKLSFDVPGRLGSVDAFGSQHAFSWMKFQMLLNKVTPFRFTSWDECYDAVHLLEDTLMTPTSVTIKRTGEFINVTEVHI